MRDKGVVDWVPSEGANTELNDGELLSGVFDFEVTDVITVEIEGFAPGRAGDAGHFEVDCDEIGGADVMA